jgi:hypothetical protein
MAATIPEAKLVAILRHPVDRAYSHYQMQEAKFPDKREFADVIQLEMDGGTPAVPPPHHSYLRVGRYHENLQRFLDYFPRSALLVMLMEDLAQDPAGTYRQLCRHIGVEATELPTNLGTAFNATKPVRSKAVRRFMLRSRAFKRLPRDWGLWLDRLNRVKSGYPPLDPVMRQRLLDYYADDTTALAELLDRDLSAWLR